MAEPVNHKCVQRVMRKMGVRAVIREKKRSRYVLGVSDSHVVNVAAPNSIDALETRVPDDVRYYNREHSGHSSVRWSLN